MKLNNFVVNKTAKNTEIMLAYFLKEKIYPNEKLIVGDENGKFPDIRNMQGTLGIEVVQAEQAEDFASNMIWKKYEEFKGDARKLKTYIKSKLTRFEILLFINKNKVEAWKTSLYGHSAYYSKHLFETVIRKKLEKLNSGNYSAINGEINLAILSIFRAKSDRVIKQIQQKYFELQREYTQNFSKIFVLFTDKLFEIDKNEIRKFEITDNELNLLKSKFKSIASKSRH